MILLDEFDNASIKTPKMVDDSSCMCMDIKVHIYMILWTYYLLHDKVDFDTFTISFNISTQQQATNICHISPTQKSQECNRMNCLASLHISNGITLLCALWPKHVFLHRHSHTADHSDCKQNTTGIGRWRWIHDHISWRPYFTSWTQGFYTIFLVGEGELAFGDDFWSPPGTESDGGGSRIGDGVRWRGKLSAAAKNAPTAKFGVLNIK